MASLSSVPSRGPAVVEARGSAREQSVDESDENTKRWYTDPQLLLTERLRAETERSDLRARPEPPARPVSAPTPVVAQPVDVQRVRGLYEQFLRVIGPAAKPLFELELRHLQLRPSTMTERGYAALVQRLTLRIPDVTARENFKAQALVEPWP
jgi:hypothetical protein